MIQFEPAAFLCDDLDVRPVGLTIPLERFSGKIYHIFNLVRLSRPEMVSIAVCGGVSCGGVTCGGVSDGSEGQDFYAFDIYVITAEGGYFLPVDDVNTLFSTAGLLYARSIFSDLLDGLLFPPDRTRVH